MVLRCCLTIQVVRYRFASLARWSNISLLATLEPADGASERVFEQLKTHRAALSDAFVQTVGIKSGDTYVPHVTLGYFANHDVDEQTAPLLDALGELFRPRPRGRRLLLNRPARMGFGHGDVFQTGALNRKWRIAHGELLEEQKVVQADQTTPRKEEPKQHDQVERFWQKEKFPKPAPY